MSKQLKEDELISEEVYQRALFDLDMARRLSRLEGKTVKPAPPPRPILPCSRLGCDYRLSLELVIELRKYNIPRPSERKRGWW